MSVLTPFGRFDRDRLTENAPLAPLTTWRVGGAARWLLEPRGDELPSALAACNRKGIPIYLLGAGSNTLVSDAGLPGLVISFRRSMRQIELHSDCLIAEAGSSLPAIARAAAGKGYAGFEFLAGIPGTVGGGVTLNCGIEAGGRQEIRDILQSVETLDSTGEVRKVGDIRELALGYRTSKVHELGLTVVRATFSLRSRGDPAVLRAATGQLLAQRRKRQPINKRTAGSTFKSPTEGASAWWYIDQCCLRGTTIGGARISPTHANWIENCGGATAADINCLIELIQMKVHAKFGVTLEPEIHRLDRHPIHAGG